jgi:hypothetical protein
LGGVCALRDERLPVITKVGSTFAIPSYNDSNLVQVAAKAPPTTRDLKAAAAVPATAGAEAPAPHSAATMPRAEQILASRLRDPSDWADMATRQGRSIDGYAAKAVLSSQEREAFDKYGMSIEQFNAALERAYTVASEPQIRRWISESDWTSFLQNASAGERARVAAGKMSSAEVISIADKEFVDGEVFKPRYQPLAIIADKYEPSSETVSLPDISERFKLADRTPDYDAAKAKLTSDELDAASKDGITIEAFAKALLAASQPMTTDEAESDFGDDSMKAALACMSPSERKRYQAGEMSYAEIMYIVDLSDADDAKTHKPFSGSRQMP